MSTPIESLRFKRTHPERSVPEDLVDLYWDEQSSSFFSKRSDGTTAPLGGASTAADITDAGATGIELMQAATPAEGRAAIGAVTYGAGAPLDANGADGELYIDEDSGVLYKKAAGTWASAFSPSNQEVLFVTALPSAGTGNNGDLAVIYTDGVISGLAEKSGGAWTQVATNAVTIPRPSDAGVIELVDHFLGGPPTSASGAVAGELSWEVLATIGSGSARLQSNTSYSLQMGVLRIITGATSGNVTTIQFSNGSDGGNTFITGSITRLSNFVKRWEFAANTTGDFHLGFSGNPAAAQTAPTRFVGIRALAGTTNFEFVVTNGTPVTVDSGVPVDDGWHTFELSYDPATSEWLMAIDGGAQSRLAVTLATSLTITMAAWVKTNAASIESLYIDTFQFYGKR